MKHPESAEYAVGMFVLMTMMRVRAFAQYAVAHYAIYAVKGLLCHYAQNAVNQSAGYIALGLD